jgi:hypothetical protein
MGTNEWGIKCTTIRHIEPQDTALAVGCMNIIMVCLSNQLCEVEPSSWLSTLHMRHASLARLTSSISMIVPPISPTRIRRGRVWHRVPRLRLREAVVLPSCTLTHSPASAKTPASPSLLDIPPRDATPVCLKTLHLSSWTCSAPTNTHRSANTTHLLRALPGKHSNRNLLSAQQRRILTSSP